MRLSEGRVRDVVKPCETGAGGMRYLGESICVLGFNGCKTTKQNKRRGRVKRERGIESEYSTAHTVNRQLEW
jgi:hypothetical protein